MELPTNTVPAPAAIVAINCLRVKFLFAIDLYFEAVISLSINKLNKFYVQRLFFALLS